MTKTTGQIEYQIIRSSRKTLALTVRADGTVLARAPLRLPEHKIDQFVREKTDWLLAQIEKQRDIHENAAPLSEQELQNLTDKARSSLPKIAERYAQQMGVVYTKITIRHQKTLWGSCSKNGNLSFNCLLMLAPPKVAEYVVVHELCHLKQRNHSALFWDEVAHYLPDYQDPKRWLKENGQYLMARNPV